MASMDGFEYKWCKEKKALNSVDKNMYNRRRTL
jgi:hypothetical protein